MEPLELAGACNIRDIGGYETADGRWVRTGQVLRGDSPHRLTDADLTVLAGLELRTVLDLRSEQEIRALGPAPLRGLGVETIHVPIRHTSGEAQVLRITAETSADGSAAITLAQLYRGFLEHSGPDFARIVALVAEPSRRPVLFHCLAGKDRTGVLAGLLLRVLGVPPEVVCADYAATAAVMGRFQELTNADRDRLGLRRFEDVDPELVSARVETMAALLEHLDADYGGPLAYLETHGVQPGTVESLREGLLDD